MNLDFPTNGNQITADGVPVFYVASLSCACIVVANTAELAKYVGDCYLKSKVSKLIQAKTVRPAQKQEIVEYLRDGEHLLRPNGRSWEAIRDPLYDERLQQMLASASYEPKRRPWPQSWEPERAVR